MINCHFCGGNGKGCICRSRSANDNSPGVIRLPSDERLGAPSSVQRLAIAYGALGISRRKLLDHLADLIFNDDRIVIDAQGYRVIIDAEWVDRAFRTEEDMSIRWVSDFFGFKNHMPCRDAQARTLPRLQVLWLALFIRQPDTAISVIR